MTAQQRKPARNTRRARGRRTNRERSTLPYRNGDAAPASVTTPASKSDWRRSSSRTGEAGHEKWLRLHASTAAAPASIPTLAQYLMRWLAEVVQPNREPATYAYYEVMARRYIIPVLGGTRLDQLQLSDVQAWLGTLAAQCQCCSLGKDAARPAGQRRCCAVGECCGNHPGSRTVQAARNTLRAALNHAKDSKGLLNRNVAAMAQVSRPPRRRRSA